MNISENQIRNLNESLDIVNLDRIKFAELFFIYLKENHTKYENIFSRIQLEDVKHFMNSARNISLSSVQYSQLEKAIQNFGTECIKICNQAEEIPILEKSLAICVGRVARSLVFSRSGKKLARSI